MIGFEPMTDGLRNRCSTAELHWRKRTLGPPFCLWLGCAIGERTREKIYTAIGGNATGKVLVCQFVFGGVGICGSVGGEFDLAVFFTAGFWGLICLTILAGFG